MIAPLSQLTLLFCLFTRVAVGETSDGRRIYGTLSTEFFLESVIVGVTTMAVIQVVRRCYPFRGRFHRRMLYKWVVEESSRRDDDMEELDRRCSIRDTEWSWRAAIRTYDLPLELLTAQLSSIAEQLLESMSQYAEAKDVEIAALAEKPEFRLLQSLARPELKDERNAITQLRSKESAAYRTGVALAIQRNLDQFQIDTGDKWRRRLLVAAIVISLVVFSMGTFFFDADPFIKSGVSALGARVLSTVLVAVFAGYLATVARDLVAIVERLRR